ncbi:MAG TPA: decarboxylating 6-phosphogluconate dehydrogenase [Clostridiales bacterium]|nr:decarboxylating 6-phosphogluconate dehydrogenase [Clostridiales bacterium]
MNKADIGLIGLAVMGENLVMNMESKGFTVAVYNRSVDKVSKFTAGRAKGKNIIGTYSIEELVAQLKVPRKVMIMVKAGQPVDDFIEKLIPVLDKGDIIIDGGNAHFPDTIRRTKYVEDHGLLFIGTGVSGGEEGALKGPSIMPGGSPAAWPAVKPIFQAISAKVEDGTPCCDWVGANGAGHFVKMVHNGIEYGLMAAYAEGFNLLRHANDGDSARAVDAETAPLRHPEHFRYDFKLDEIAELWRRGSVIGSWLLDLGARALAENPGLDGFAGRVADSGEGRWTIQAAVDAGVPAPVLSAALYGRFASRDRDDFANRLLSALRRQFGGHQEPTVEGGAHATQHPA